MINTYSTDSKGAKSKTDQRRAERERQINIMDSLISDFEQSASSGGPGVGQSPSDAESPNSRRGSEHNTSLHSVRSEGADADARLPHAPTGEFFSAGCSSEFLSFRRKERLFLSLFWLFFVLSTRCNCNAWRLDVFLPLLFSILHCILVTSCQYVLTTAVVYEYAFIYYSHDSSR